MDVEAFILIGGRSNRFGSDKAFFEFDGTALASKAAATVETAFPGISVTFVAASEDQFGIRSTSLERPVIVDLRKGFGAWSGVDAALSRSGAAWTLVLACDLPFVTPEFLNLLARSTDENVQAVIPRQPDRRLQPLCGFYKTREVRSVVRDIIEKGDIPPLSSLFHKLPTTFIDAGPDVLRNVNSPADLG